MFEQRCSKRCKAGKPATSKYFERTPCRPCQRQSALIHPPKGTTLILSFVPFRFRTVAGPKYFGIAYSVYALAGENAFICCGQAICLMGGKPCILSTSAD